MRCIASASGFIFGFVLSSNNRLLQQLSKHTVNVRLMSRPFYQI
jgi:hypothetical protein